MDEKNLMKNFTSDEDPLQTGSNFLFDEDESRFCYKNLPAGFVKAIQKLSFSTIFFIVTGSCRISYDRNEDVVFKLGEMAFIPKSSALRFEVLQDSKIVYLTISVYFELSFRKEYCYNVKEKIQFHFFPLSIKTPMFDFITLLIDYLENDAECVPLYNIKIKELSHIFRSFYSPKELTEFFYPVIGKTLDFKDFVLGNYRPGIKVWELAELYSMDERVFMRRFEEEFGIPASKWILRKTCQRILVKASQPDVTIQDLMDEVCINDATQFNRFCRKNFNETPKKLILRCQNL